MSDVALEQGFNDEELADIMKEIETLEEGDSQEQSGEADSVNVAEANNSDHDSEDEENNDLMASLEKEVVEENKAKDQASLKIVGTPEKTKVQDEVDMAMSDMEQLVYEDEVLTEEKSSVPSNAASQSNGANCGNLTFPVGVGLNVSFHFNGKKFRCYIDSEDEFKIAIDEKITLTYSVK